jgi:ferredoxin
VAAISPGPNDPEFQNVEQLFIDPSVCIDCGACVDVCPVLAIFQRASLPEQWQHYVEINRQYFEVLPR